ncbi:ribonuclease P protein component [Flavimaricola marinus]|uniref:Ribonuclease P protein component n=1 Tax=Flavimaricola marinus TaxID=1819565 RepID=A0A238L9N5_9RHOB|nr:ribonuclease P protein component [Flavimaricola marinus]SMY06378.1 ribonuclease P [Flavimaricola marinus]
MTPPVAPKAGSTAPADRAPRAVFSCADAGGGSSESAAAAPSAAQKPVVMTKRSDFLRASRGLRHAAPGFHFQARKRDESEPASGMRVGYTCSKKVGNAVARNRAKRRLREAARLVLPTHGRPGWDYVLVGKAGATAERDFVALQADLVAALKRVHRL